MSKKQKQTPFEELQWALEGRTIKSVRISPCWWDAAKTDEIEIVTDTGIHISLNPSCHNDHGDADADYTEICHDVRVEKS